MIQNYLITALRNLTRNKVYALVNIGGLAVGLAASILILLFVTSELGYDKFWKNSDRVYRMHATMFRPGQAPSSTTLTPGPMMPLLKNSFPGEIEAATHFRYSRPSITKGELSFREQMIIADPGFTDVFELEMISGKATDAFADSNSLLLNEAQALRLFGTTSVMGEIVTIDQGSVGPIDYKVVGVMANLPETTHMNIPYLTFLDPSRFLDQPWVLEFWYAHNVWTYVKLADGVTQKAVEAGFPGFLDKHFDPGTTPGLKADIGTKASEMEALNLLPIQDIHLYSSTSPQLMTNGDHIQMKMLAGIATAILFIAMINFTNLTNARALRRLKEIVVRKVHGAMRVQLIFQFLGEAVGIAFLALLVALPLVEFSTPLFSELIGKEIALASLFEGNNLTSVLLIVLLTGLFGGLYPALILSSSRPTEILMGTRGGTTGTQPLITALTIIQYAASIALIIMTTIVASQTTYLIERDIGIKDKNTFMLLGTYTEEGQRVADTFYNEIGRLPGVVNHAGVNRMIPLRGGHNPTTEMTHDNKSYQVIVEQLLGNFNLLDVLGAKLMAGRMFSEDFRSDLPVRDSDGHISRGSVVTERTARAFGFSNPEDALNHIFSYDDGRGYSETMTIVGVVGDMNLRSARSAHENIIFKLYENVPSIDLIELTDANQAETIIEIEKIYTDLLPSQTFNAGMLDEEFRGFYADDERQARIFGYSALLSIFVSSVGLFGLAALTAENKIREIGVRKVFGAQVCDIARLMLWQFSKPVMLANLLGWPIAWYTMGEWLNNFVFRIDMPFLPYIMAGMIAIAIAWLTIGIHTYKVARTSPINALRCQ